MVRPSLGLTQMSTPAAAGFPTGPASKHAAAHCGVWNADCGAASAAAGRTEAITVSRTGAATRLNRPSVEGQLGDNPRGLPSARERRTFKQGHREQFLRRGTRCLMAIVKLQPQVHRGVLGGHEAVDAVFEFRPGVGSGRRHRGGSVSSPEHLPGEEKGAG
jgi:hypothetical protein